MYLFENRKEVIGVIICIACAAILGVYPPAARGVYQEGGNVTFVILATTFFRFIGLYIFALVNNQRPFTRLSESGVSIYTGLLQAAIIIGILGGSYYMPGGVVIIIVYTYSLMLLLFSAWRNEMKLNSINIPATLIALGGLALVLEIYKLGLAYPLPGIILAFTAALAAFSRTYIFGKQSQIRHPLLTGAETFTIAFAFLLLLIPWQFPQIPHSLFGFTMIIAASLSLMIGSIGMFYGIAYLGSYRFSMIMTLEPVFTSVFGILIVQDSLNPWQYTGAGLVLASLLSLQLFDKQKAQA